MEIIDNKALLINVRDPGKYTSIIETSKYVRQVSDNLHEIMVKWDYDNVATLTALGIKKVPATIYKDYKWSGRFTPMTHQKDTASFIVANPKCFVFSEMGVGKTASAAWAADYLLKKKRIKRVLVVCPLSIMKAAWQRDLFSVLPHRSVGIAHGSVSTRRKIIAGDYEFVIINYDGILTVLDELIAANFDFIVADESSYLKNVSTHRWKAFHKLAKASPRVVLMTGTPAAQSPVDAFGLAKIICPDRVPRFFGGWRDVVMQKITMFKYTPRPRANDIVFAALQPAIRYTKNECLDLPDMVYETRDVPLTPQQEKYYNLLKKQLLVSAAGEEISAINAAVQMTKLLQISCITGDTMVLCYCGWKPLSSVLLTDKVWDGIEWVAHEGVIYKGAKATVTLDGVRMTADHRVLTVNGWHTAQEIIDGKSSERFNRTAVRIPESNKKERNYGRNINPSSTLGVPVLLRKYNSPQKPVFEGKTSDTPKKLWLPPWKRNAQNVLYKALRYMDKNEPPMYVSTRQRLQELWGSWDNSMRTMARIIREFLGRYARYISRTFNFGSEGQQRGIFQRQLSMGNSNGTMQQHSIQQENPNSSRGNDRNKCSGVLWIKKRDITCPNNPVWMGHNKSVADPTGTEEVYDIKNAGPRNRFTVKGVDNEPIIVHNCGSVYSDDGKTIHFDISNRLSELEAVIDESLQKVIVFAPYTHTIEVVESYLQKKKIPCAVINGAVSSTKRAAIIENFQTTQDLRVIIIQPQAAAHGITLTAANTIVWFGPTPSVETYLQANARAHRNGQQHKVTVIMLQGSPAEEKMYKMLNSKIDHHMKLIDLYDEVLHE